MDRFLHQANVREEDLALLRPGPPVEERVSWKRAFVARITSLDVKGASTLDLCVRKASEEQHLRDIIGTPTFVFHPLASSIGYRRMCAALKVLCLSKWPPTERRPSMAFSPSLRHILLPSDLHNQTRTQTASSQSGRVSSSATCSDAPLPGRTPPRRGHERRKRHNHHSHSASTTGSHVPPPSSPLSSATEAEKFLDQLSLGALTAAQHRALCSALINRLTLIQGPPGTGKTHTACCIIEAWCRAYPDQRILAGADSNIAADNLSLGLQSRGIRSARVGAGTENAGNDLFQEAAQLSQQQQEGGDGSGYVSEFSKNKAQKQEKWKLCRQLLHRNQVIITTCIGSGHPMFDDIRFERIVIDECTQSTETASLVPLSRGGSALVLIGDFNQLAGTVLSREALARGLSTSLLERLSRTSLADVILLDVQRRMHPSIAEFPNYHFYNGSIRNQDVDDHSRPPVSGFVFPNPVIRVCLVRVSPKRGLAGLEALEGPSRYNAAYVARCFNLNCLGPVKHT